MGEATGPFNKNLQASDGRTGPRPVLATVLDDAAQAEYVVQQVLCQREAGIALKRQVVLFRTGHHSDFLEVLLNRRNIPFVKHGGLKFVEAAHVKDVLAILRWGDNPRHALAAFRALQLLPGFGPVRARACLKHVSKQPGFQSLRSFSVPGEAANHWPAFADLMATLADSRISWHDKLKQAGQVIKTLIELRYENAQPRLADIDILIRIGECAGSSQRFLSDMALDAPNAAGAWGDDAHLDEDYLILSTVHSAKGQQWRNVFVLNVADGNFPNEYSTANPQAIEEERRLLYVAMTRAEQNLHLIEPQRYYLTQQQRFGAAHVYGARSRFLSPSVQATLDCTQRRDAPAESICSDDETSSSDQFETKGPHHLAGAVADIWK